MDRAKIGEKLRTLRSEKHVTQDQIAKEIGVSPAAYAMYEAGERSPRDNVKIKIANYFNVSVADIFFN